MQGKEIFIRIVDHGSAGWGHVNFDNFRFLRRAVPKPSLRASKPATADDYPYAGLAGEEAVKVMKLPEGFKATLCRRRARCAAADCDGDRRSRPAVGGGGV